MIRPHGLAPITYLSYLAACKELSIAPPVIVQTIGTAPASAGYHAKDGKVWVKDHWEDYCAALDVRSRDFPSPLSIKAFLACAARHYIIGWYRYTGAFANNRHLHLIDVRLKMKPQLAAQVRDYLHGRTGLVGHVTERFYTAPKAADDLIRAAFLVHNG